MDKIEMFKIKYNRLVNHYVKDYKGFTILRIVDNDFIIVPPEFLDHLPEEIRSSVELLVKESNAS